MMRRLVFFLAVLLMLLPACSARATPAAVSTLSMQEQAAAEATAIIEQARATAMIHEAQVQASALLQQTATFVPAVAADTQAGAEQPATPTLTLTPASDEDGEDASAATSRDASEAVSDDEYKIELIDVTYGGDGGFIMVNFYATFLAAGDLWQGEVSVTDEQTGTVYDLVSTMPIIGPLIARPKEWGQPGYVMIVNSPPGLPSNTFVTVVLGKFKKEHVPIRP